MFREVVRSTSSAKGRNCSNDGRSTSQGARKRKQLMARAVCESMERRLLLTSTLRNLVPTTIAPGAVAQTLLAPGNNSFSLTTASTIAVTASPFRFVVNNATAGQLTQFSTNVPAGVSSTDAAIALFDSSGNRLQLQDADSGNDADESLSVALQSGQQYEVEFLGLLLSNTTAQVVNLNINPGPQATGSTITLNPMFGNGTLMTSSAPNAFTSSTSVRYFPVNFLDGGTSGSIHFSPAGPDTAVDATLFQLPTSALQGLGAAPTWSVVGSTATSVGGSGTIAVSPPAGSDVTDGDYVLAVAPAGFAAAAEPVTITASAGNLLSPAAANPATVAASIPQTLSAIGTISGAVNGSISGSTPTLYSVTAAITGTMNVQYQPLNSNPLLSVYGPGGTSLLAVSSSTTAGADANASFTAIAGTTYYLLVGPDAQTGVNDTFTLTTSQTYTSTPVSVTTALGQTTGLNLSTSTGPSFFTLSPVPGSSYVALQIAPTAGLTVQASVLGPNQAVQTSTASGPGQPLTVIINQLGNPGPYDVMLSSAAGTGTATFKYTALVVPTQIAINQLPTSPLNLAMGGETTSANAVTTGQLTGFQYYLPASSANPGTTTYTAQAAGGVAAIVLHYVQNGSVMQLAESALSPINGLASVSDTADAQTLHAVAALAVNFSGTGTVQLAVSGPLPSGIGLGFIPNALPNQPPPAQGFQSSLMVTGVSLATSQQIDLYTTQIPFDLTGTTAPVTFTPTDAGGPLQATVSVLNGANVVIATGTNAPGQPLSISLIGLTPGQTLRFEVTPVPGSNLGSGQYSLAMTVNTTDPRPFLVTEQSFLPFSSTPVAGNNYFPQNLQITQVPFGPTGAVGDFTSSTPYNPTNGTGSIQVFEFSNIPYNFGSPQGFQITTTDLDPNINTNFALFYQNKNSSTPNTFIPLPGTSVNFDYFPGDRSSVDARIIDINVNNIPFLVLGEFSDITVPVYAVVMNEQGTQGHFNIAATAVPTPATVGPGTGVPAKVLPFAPSSGLADLNPAAYAVTATSNDEVFSIRAPVDVGNGESVLTVSGGSPGQTFSADIFTPPRGIIAGQSIDFGTGTFNASGTATIGLGNAGIGPIEPLGSGSSYNLSVGVTSGTFPAGGLILSNFTIGRAAVSPIASASPTNFPLANGFKPAISRIDPAPNGTFTDGLGISGTSVTAEFSVSTAGPVVIHMQFPSTAVNTTLGLYQSGEHGTVINQFTTTYASDGVLLDSQNAKDSNGLYTINANLLPGTYFVVGASSTFFNILNRGSATFTGTLPAFQAGVLTVNPTTGNNTVAEETTVNQDASNSGGETDEEPQFLDSRFTSNFYSFTAPANVSGQPISVFIADTASNVPINPPNGFGNINLFIWKDVNGVFSNLTFAVAAIRNSSSPYQDGFTLTATGDAPTPGAVYYVAIDLNGYENPAYFGISVPILTSGLPDYSVQPVTLAADNGKTLITSSIINESFTAAPPATYLLQEGSLSSTRLLFPLAPFAAYPISTDWTPAALTDVVTVTADPSNAVMELNESNNTQSTPLSSVDSTTPSATIQLVEPDISGESPITATTGGVTWGRYISGVSGQTTPVIVAASDGGAGNLYEVSVVGPPDANTPAVIYDADIFTAPKDSFATFDNIDFGQLMPTSASNPNLIKFTAIDKFGLSAPTTPVRLDVIQPPNFLTGGIPTAGNTGAGGSITFSRSTDQFTYSFQDAVISYDAELNTLLGVQVPAVGTEPVAFLVAIDANGTGGLNPAEGVPLTVSGEISLSAFNDNIFDKHYTPADAGGTVKFNSNFILSGATLLPGSASVTLQIANLQLFQIKSPMIPLITLGIPGVLSIDTGVQFQFGATLSAGAKIGTNPADATSASAYFDSLGLMSPTFIEPSVSASATVSGQVDVLGFDLAKLSGTVGLSLNLVAGLDNSDPDAVFTPSQAADNIAFDLNAQLNIGLAASVPIIGNIWTYNYTQDLGNIVNTVQHGIFLTDPPSMATGKFIAPGTGPGSGTVGDVVPAEQDTGIIPISGTSLIGAYPIDPSPQIVIDNSVTNGNALSVQLVNVGTSSAPLANLAFTTRTAGTWSGMTTLSENNDVGTPQLALTHDGAAAPAVVVYDLDKVAGSPSTQTVNQRFDSEEIAYRYYNGTSWSSESVLTNDNLYDSEPQAAFNSSGAGVLAYVHNTDGAPLNSSGAFDANSNDIEVSNWNPSTHSFGAPVVLGTAGDGVSDASPAAFVDASGNKYVVWVRGIGTSNQLMYSVNNGAGWSGPAPLQLAGMPTGGTFNNVSLGSDGNGRVDVVFSYSVMNANGTVTTTLFNRPATIAGFAVSQPVVQLASGANFSGLRTTSSPSGAMVVYWQQSTGQADQIEEATVLNGVESGPTQISDDPNVATSPSLAVDGSGTMQVLYDNSIPYGGSSQGTTSDPQVGAPLASGVFSSSVQDLPQLTFTSGLSFQIDSASAAASGSSVTGTAVIANRGLVAANVTISAFDGIPGSGGIAVGTPQMVTLQPGASYTVSQAFTVLAGTNTYSLQLTTSGGQAFDTTEDLSSATLSGLADLVAINLTDNAQSPQPGSAQTLQAMVLNASTTPVGLFSVTLYQGDPLSPQFGVTALATQVVPGLAAMQETTLAFPVTIPAGAGDDVYTVVVDSGNAITESNKNNNEARYELDFTGDPAISAPAPAPAVSATLLNTGNSNNVQVTVNVTNFGSTTIVNVPVDLQVSRNGGTPTTLGQMVIATLGPGATTAEVFTVTALAGDDIFIGSIDSSAFAEDSNPSNDIGTAQLTVQGLPTLGATLALSTWASVAGSPLTLSATVSNTGLADGVSVPLVVLASLTTGGPSVVVGAGSVSVTALSSQQAQIPLNTTGLAPGLYTITFEIDPNQTIVQGSVAGNVVTTPEILLVPSLDTLTGTSGADEITLIQDHDHAHIDWILNGSSGGQLAINDPKGLTINGNVGNDAIFLNNANDDPLPATLHLNGAFTINGLQGANPLAATTLDIGQSTVFISYANAASDPIAMIKSYLQAGYNNGSWNGTPTASTGVITSATAAGNVNHSTAIGYADFGDGSGVNLTPNTIELKYTQTGDANLDGSVNFSDLVMLAQNYGGKGKSWDQGDFNYDGSVNFADLVALAQNYGKSVGGMSVAAVEASAAENPASLTASADSTTSSKRRRPKIHLMRPKPGVHG